MLLNQGYVPCNKQIHIKIPENELQMIHDRMEPDRNQKHERLH